MGTRKPNNIDIIIAQHNMSRGRHVMDEIRYKLNNATVDILLL